MLLVIQVTDDSRNDPFDWMAIVLSSVIDASRNPVSPEWDSRDSYMGSLLANFADEFDCLSRQEKRDIFIYLLGSVLGAVNLKRGNDE